MEENQVQEEVEVESEVTEEESSAFDAAFEDDDFDLSAESGKQTYFESFRC